MKGLLLIVGFTLPKTELLGSQPVGQASACGAWMNIA